MSPHTPPNLPFWAYLLPLALIAVVILRNARARQLRIERMWVAPLVILLISGLSISQQPPSGPMGIGLDVVALGLGALLGWQRGRFTQISVDPATQVITSQTSPIGMLLILVIFALRGGVRVYAMQNAGALHLPVTDLTDAFLLLAVGLVCTQRLEMALRASRLLNEVRGKPAV